LFANKASTGNVSNKSEHVTSQTAGELNRQFNDMKYDPKVRKYIMHIGYSAHLYSLARQHQHQCQKFQQTQSTVFSSLK
jgi:hypothetical protein